ncbi:MAG: hypothetical protein JNM22_14750 [Saprospiraceae bacterium]|nr:hypothetical protein [Saprospiraceae bacterium]
MTVPIKIFSLFVTSIFVLTASILPEKAPKALLSEYGYFSGALNQLQPAEGVFAYEVNAPLFSDYAEKSRFIFLPSGAAMQYRESGAFQFPEGAAIIKNFYYPLEAAHPEKGRQIVETRLLLKDVKGWKALTYVWNKEQTDATLEVAGASFPVSWINTNSKKVDLEYVVPNVNQCKGCHSYDGQFTPIGVTLKQLDNTSTGSDNQIQFFQQQGKIDGIPAAFEPGKVFRLADYRKREQSLDASARAYLDANCAHCHNAHGPASTSGMFLNAEETDLEHLGVGKPPVAAGRGSGNRKYGIVPGKPSESILLYRMEHTDPGIRMPELGRQMVHEEGVALIREWIKAL